MMTLLVKAWPALLCGGFQLTQAALCAAHRQWPQSLMFIGAGTATIAAAWLV